MTAVGGRDVIIKKIQIERVKEQQARELMRWEAEQHVPFDMESVELDFQILDPDGDGLRDERPARRRQARARSSPRCACSPTPASSAPSSTSTPSRCTTRSRSTIPTRCVGVVGLVNIGHEVTNINILDDGVPILTRDITVGTRRFREDLQRERGTRRRTRREQLLQGYDRSPHLDAVIESRGEEIAVGVERAAAFLASSSRSGCADAARLHVRRRCSRSRAHRGARRSAARLASNRRTRCSDLERA